MLLVLLTVSGALFGSSTSVQTEEVCYGRSWKIPPDFATSLYQGSIYFTPSNGGAAKIVIQKGEPKDPRFKVSYGSLYLTDITERDEGLFFLEFSGRLHELARLKVLECAEKVTKEYGYLWNYPVPRKTEFLEFTPLHSLDQPKILWNRSVPQTGGSKGQVKKDDWEMYYVTQADNGYYNFRQKDNRLLSRILLKVQEQTTHYDAKENSRLLIGYPWIVKKWNVTFIPEGEKEPKTLIENRAIIKDNWFFERIQLLQDGIEIDPVESKDSGIFEFKDPEGNLAMTAQVEVNQENRLQMIALGVAGLILLVGFACCCCCLKKKRHKKDKSSPQTSAAPAVYYHNENQPTGASFSTTPPPSAPSYQPVSSHVSEEPTSTCILPPAYHEVFMHENTSQPEATLPGGQGFTAAPSAGLDFLSSNQEPQFELKGLNFPTAPPLSSESNHCDVYNSEKLNFL